MDNLVELDSTHDLLIRFVRTTITSDQFRRLFGADPSQYRERVYTFENRVGTLKAVVSSLEEFASYLPPDKQEMIKLFIVACYIEERVDADGKLTSF